MLLSMTGRTWGSPSDFPLLILVRVSPSTSVGFLKPLPLQTRGIKTFTHLKWAQSTLSLRQGAFHSWSPRRPSFARLGEGSV